MQKPGVSTSSTVCAGPAKEVTSLSSNLRELPQGKKAERQADLSSSPGPAAARSAALDLDFLVYKLGVTKGPTGLL